ncbi:CaiB/BaiF CoA transferase family protein [Chloroflexota bacterium]
MNRKKKAPDTAKKKAQKSDAANLLDDIRIIDFTHILAGPICTQLLGDLGAEVIKIEPVGLGEFARHPPRESDALAKGTPVNFISLNRNKKSVPLNLKNPRGLQVIHKLIETADVVVNNMRPGAMESLELGYEALKSINPSIIYASISGWGSKGPDIKKPGQDVLAQARSGLMSVTGDPDRLTAVGSSVADLTAGTLCAFGIVTALYHRMRTGEGQEVQTSLLAAGIHTQISNFPRYMNTGQLLRKSGNGIGHITAPYGAWHTKDKPFAMVGSWEILCRVIEREDLVTDPRFKTEKGRLDKRAELGAIVEGELRKRPRDEWIKLFEAEGLWCAPVQTYDEVCSDPQVVQNEMMMEIEHPVEGSLKVVANPVKFSKSNTDCRLSPPLLGQHTEEILTALGYPKKEIEELKQSGVVG